MEITITVPNFVLYLLLAGIVCVFLYDAINCLVLNNEASERWMSRRNYPLRLVVIGVLAGIGAVVWLFKLSWILALVLITAVIFVVLGFVILAKTHKKMPIPSAQP